MSFVRERGDGRGQWKPVRLIAAVIASHSLCILLLLSLLVASCVRWESRPSPPGWGSCAQPIDDLEPAILRAHHGPGTLIVSAIVRGELGDMGVGVFDDGEVVFLGGRGMNCCGLFARRIGAAKAARLRDELVAAELGKNRHSVPADAPVGRIRLRRDDGSSESIVFSPVTMTPEMERMWQRLHEVAGTTDALRPLPEDAPWLEPGTCWN